MYTLPDEPEGDDHYADFRRTIAFLGGEVLAEDVTVQLRTMRETMLGAGDPVIAQTAKQRAEELLRTVMCRTERLSTSEDRDGMLVERTLGGVKLTAQDIGTYGDASEIARCVGRQDIFDFWHSSPYLFNIMEDYQVKRQLRDAVESPSADLREALAGARGLLDWEDIRQYRTIDPGNAKMRGLVHDVLDRGMWRALWIPPALPYYEPEGVYAEPQVKEFTKRLLFSAWAVVPKAVSFVLSYEAERRAQEAATTVREYDAERATGLLRFQWESGRLTGMPVLALLYPSTSLARLGDPLRHARSVGGSLPADRRAVEESVRTSVARALDRLPPGPADGTEDQRWYWAAPFLLDREALGGDQDDFFDEMTSWGDDEEVGDSRFVEHVREAQRLQPHELGRRPDDLVEVIVTLALAGLGNCSLRALARVCGGDESLSDVNTRYEASNISWSLRAMFNRPESMGILRPRGSATDAYWRAVLGHCMDGNLQAVLDEYLHVLVESEGLQDDNRTERSAALAETAEQALTLRAARVSVDEIRVDHGSPRIESRNGRVHFAARFGRAQSDEADVLQREGQVRAAFNSPFWPFVLASTSVGQEGLDFHVYSHAIVHWNLPGNPVDLEQREGRVHRYKGHAIRRNVARDFAHAAFHAQVDDPWYAMFLAAVEHRTGADDLCPFWMYAPEGGARIERYVPALPLSREAARYNRLRRTLGAYRLVMGQPRQEDLLRYLGTQGGDLSWARIDLSPPRPGDA